MTTITPPVQGTIDENFVRFQHYRFTFTADSTTTTLQFTDIGTGNSCGRYHGRYRVGKSRGRAS